MAASVRTAAAMQTKDQVKTLFNQIFANIKDMGKPELTYKYS
jgi:hypothetical protein